MPLKMANVLTEMQARTRQLRIEDALRREQETANARMLREYQRMMEPQLHTGPTGPTWMTMTWGELGYQQAGVASEAMASMQVVDEPSREMLVRETVTVPEEDLADPRKALARDAEALLGYKGLREHVHEPGRLRIALAKLEIQILDQKSVDRYKAQMVEHYQTANKMPSPTWRLFSLRNYGQPVPEFALQKAVEIKRELPEAEFYIDQLAVDPFLIVTLKMLPDTMTNHTSRELDPETSAYIEVWDEPKFEAEL